MKAEKNYNHPHINTLDNRLLVALATTDIFTQAEKAKILCLDIWNCNFRHSAEYIKGGGLNAHNLIIDYPAIQSKLLILHDILEDIYDELACIQGVEDEDLKLYRKNKVQRYNILDDEQINVCDTSDTDTTIREAINRVSRHLNKETE